MHSVILFLNEVGHVVIAGAYMCLGLLALYIRLPVVWREWGARVGACLFFLGCGIHHLDMLHHIITNTRLQGTAFHHVIATFMQVVGAPLFIASAAPYVPDFLAYFRRSRA